MKNRDFKKNKKIISILLIVLIFFFGLQFLSHTFLFIGENKPDFENIKFLKDMSNLIYIDLRYNKIIEKIKPKEFDGNIRLILRDYLTLK